jgi:sec-independent protein translocase protein TatA
MGSMSIWHWVVVGAVFLLFFGRGKISELMGDVAGGIKAFKKGMAEDDDAVKKAEEEKAKLESAANSAADAAKTTASATKPN